MNRSHRRESVARTLVLAAVLLTLLLVTIVFGAQALHLTAFQQLIADRDERAVRAAATAMADQMRSRTAAVNSLAIQASVTGDPQHVLEDAGYLLTEFDRGLAVLSADGALVQTSGSHSFWTLESTLKKLNTLADTIDHPTSPTLLSVISDETAGESTLVFTSMMNDGSMAAGAVTLKSLAEKVLGDVFSPTEQAAAFIVSDDFRLLYRTGPIYWPVGQLSDHPGVAPALRGEQGATYYDEGEGQHIIAYSPIAGVDWVIVIEEPWRSVSDPVLEATESAPLVLIPALVVALVAIVFGMRRIVRPLQSLEQQTGELARGHFEAVEQPVGGIAEIQNLQSALVQMARKVSRAQRSLRDYLGSITIAQEEERSRLARDLHDDTIQSLVALTRKAQLTKMSLSGQAEADQLGEIEEMSKQIIDDLRRVARDLRPIYLEELGLAPALKMLAQDTSVSLSIPVGFSVTGNEQRLSQDVELALYRIAQEALSNMARHAHAATVEVALDFGSDTVSLNIADDGCGFDLPDSPAEMAPGGHFGLLGMQERAEIVGARLKIKSARGQGTAVEVSLSA